MHDVNLALGKAWRYLETGGEWSPELREYVNGWLDMHSALRHLEETRGLPEAKVGR